MEPPAKKKVVRPGDCIIKYAYEAGVPVNRIVTEADNAELMAQRETPNILLPGDEVTVPEKELKSEPVETEQRHVFVRREEKAEIRIKIHELGRPRANEPFHVMIGDKRFEGDPPQTDDDGLVVCQVPPNTGKATIVIGEYEDEYEVRLGHIDPIDSVSGMHGRLENLALYHSGINAPWNAESAEAMSDFLRRNDPALLEQDTRNPEEKEMQESLKESYGS